MTAQSANDMVRDHRNRPLLLVRLTEPQTAANQAMYAATGSAPAASAATAGRQPARRISSQPGTAAMKTSAVGRTTADRPSSAPATATRRAGGGSRHSSTAKPATMRAIASRSPMISRSSSSSAGRNSTGVTASVAPQPGSPRQRVTAYIITAIPSPVTCCSTVMRTSECSGRSSHSSSEYPPGFTGLGATCTAPHR
jgi:hypothetical protein